MKRFIIPTLLLGALLGGCASTTSTDAPAGFAVDTFRDGAEFAYKDADSLKGYTNVYLKSAAAMPAEGSKPLQESDMAALEFAFEDAFKAAMGNSYRLVDGPGPNTLAVEAVIGEVMHLAPKQAFSPTANNPAQKVNTYGTDIDPVTAPIAVSINAPVQDTSLCVCSVHLTIKFYDAQSMELLAQFSDHDFGADVEIAETGETSWSRVSAAMHHWCQEMAEELKMLTH